MSLPVRSSRLTADQVVSFERCLGPPAMAHTLPPAAYTDAGLHALEQEAVFHRGWVGVGRADRWPNVGDYAAEDIGGVPVVVVRDERGLRAFANSCRHRSSQVMTGAGNCSRMRCPFHAWTYGLDGRLLGAPDMAQTDNFDKADYGLIEFALAQAHGFVFLSMEADPPPIDRWLGDFDDFHADWPLADLVTSRRREFSVACNWKGFAEVFNEYYHLPYVHPDSIDDTYNRPDQGDESSGAFATQFGTTSATAALLDDAATGQLPPIAGLTGRATGGARYTWLYPNIVLAVGLECLWMYEVYPDGPDRCRAAQVVAFPKETIDRPDFDEKVGEYYRRFDVAIEEDIPILERQHRGIASPFAQQGRFAADLEPSVARFAAWYSNQMLASAG